MKSVDIIVDNLMFQDNYPVSNQAVDVTYNPTTGEGSDCLVSD